MQTDDFSTLPQNHFSVVYADPPWAFATYSKKNIKKSPDFHYDCMSLDWIKNLPVQDVATEDSVCLMWCTAPMIREGLETLESWGYKYKTMGAWAKRSKADKAWQFGLGYLYRSAMEPWILGTRGNPKSLSKSIRNLIVAPVRAHSQKPDQMIENIESQFTGPYLEMFCREARPGWSCFGNQVGLLNRNPSVDSALESEYKGDALQPKD